ncbi:phosphatase PAP2 family protein [Streptomyces sp. TRM 70351]|uniref:phosphatase PAP2 family protein n=1 Tax=Streptomyces sp. TRM 70351 TaxID=3116552 RepID=UPI002E7AB329|nr:phosphatase PAP2 family protein [Streptomyces sp. TRM 70351]MEE1929270.1 phosphatase PAP2 family protein [Streptomyces sp. TRM 70351]
MRTDRIFARLEQEPARPPNPAPGMSVVRRSLFVATLAFYVAIVAAVLRTSQLVRLDWQLMLFRPYKQWPQLHPFLDYFVVLGQRGPTAVLVAAWLGWRSWRQRTLRPLLMLGAALLLLNVTVGAAKLGMGREGPHYATSLGSNEMFLTGDIFPSGHTANAVVTWGILAYLASTQPARRRLSVVAAVFALGVGATTVYLGTHWLSDVLLGWAAGLLILLALPWCEPLAARVEEHVLAYWTRLRAAGRVVTGGVAPAPGPAAVAAGGPRASHAAPRDAASTAAEGGGQPARGAGQPVARHAHPAHAAHAARPYTVRSERSPVTPAGSRRPASDRTPGRTAPLGPRT